ncbi:MAG: iron-containing alcohol dehydrogenase [Gemmataceae bacterium]|nr:iron-containing alcohol dehydrogenase [Gemmataceae bacterium]
MRTVWTFHIAQSIAFGQDAVKQLGDIATRLRAKKALIVTDPILEKAGLLERVRQPLIAAGLTVSAFTGGEPEPSMKAGLACYDQAKSFQPDLLVGLGGGSNMDLAKLAATLLKHGGSPRDYIGDDKIPGPIFPLICIPTTAGTGSEVSAATVITDTENHIKVGILSNWLRPTVAVVDPLMTLSCPPKVTADSGIDALTHAIEAYTAVDNADFPLPPGERSVYQGKHPMGDLCAEKAITLVGKFLRRAVKDGTDLEAREGMALAALLAGMGFSNVGVALVHAMEYPVGGAVHCSHGAGNGLLLPYVMRFNLNAKLKAFAEIATLLGENISGLSERAAAEKAVAAVEKLRNDIGIPNRLRDIGIRQEQLRALAEKTFGIKRILRVNPRSVTVEEIEGVFNEAY